jgi:hypothetical protein
MNSVLDRAREELVVAFFEAIYRTFLGGLLVQSK